MSPDGSSTYEIEAVADSLLLLGVRAHSEAQQNGQHSLAYFQAAGISYERASVKYQSVVATTPNNPKLLIKGGVSLIGLSDVESATERGNLNRVSGLRMNGLHFIAEAQRILSGQKIPRNIEAAMAAVNADAILQKDPQAADDILAAIEENSSPSIKRLIKEKRKFPWQYPAAEIVLVAFERVA
jgi:hypothetical protein